jgi:multiple sugar transport system permease protein
MLAALALTLFFVFPVYWLFIHLLQDAGGDLPFPAGLVSPEHPVRQLRVCCSKTAIATTVWNSLVLAGRQHRSSPMLLGTIAAYSLVRFKTGGGEPGGMDHLQRMMPPIAIVFPIFLLYVYFGWVDSYHGLIILYTAFSLPYVTWMMRGYIEGHPAGTRRKRSRRWLHALWAGVVARSCFPDGAHGAFRDVRLHLRVRLERFPVRVWCSRARRSSPTRCR